MKFNSIFLLFFALSPLHAAIYTWIDEDGIRVYGDCIPEKCGSTAVTLKPLNVLQSEPLPALSNTLSNRSTEIENLKASAALLETETAAESFPSFGLKPPLSQYQCHQSAQQMMEPDWNVLNQAVSAKPFAANDRLLVRQFMTSLKGLWRGQLKVKYFRKENGEERVKISTYRVSANITSKDRRLTLFDIDLEPANRNETGGLHRRFFWMSLDQDGNLRSGSERNRSKNLSGKPSSYFAKRWDSQYTGFNGVTLELINNYRGLGGRVLASRPVTLNPSIPRRSSLRKLEYRFLTRKANKIKMTECYYNNGFIDTIHEWSLLQ